MKFGMFLKPTPTYKEYLLLSLIAKNPHVTQREIADNLEVSVAMVNIYIDEYEEKGLLKRAYSSTKSVTYKITDLGESRIKLLNIQYLESALAVYNEAKHGCNIFFNRVVEKGFKKILFYGAGEVAEIMLSILNDTQYEFEVLAVVDDDQEKQGKMLMGKEIIAFDDIDKFDYDGIFISTYTSAKKIYDYLIGKNIDAENIVLFFEKTSKTNC